MLSTISFERPDISYVLKRTPLEAVEEGGGVGVDREESAGPDSQAVVTGCHKPAAAVPEESKETEFPERGDDCVI